MTERLRNLWRNSLRVLRVASKPDSQEYWSSAKITGIGILVIGALGFAVFLTFRLTGLFT